MSTLRMLVVASLVLTPVTLGQEKGSKKRSETQGSTEAGTKPKKIVRSVAEQRAYDKRRAEIRKRIQTYRALMKKGKVLKTHVKVRVRLRNTEMMTGVVKDGLFVEKPAGLEFVRAEMTQPGAGLRLWYYNKTDGYIFIPYTMIKSYKVLKRLSDIEIKEIRDKIIEAERIAKEAGEQRKQRLADKQRALREGEKSAEKLDELSKKIAKNKQKKGEEQRLLGIVKEFPPDEGWGEDKINQINMRRLTLKVFPNAKERRFIEVYEDWKIGRKIWDRKQKEGEGDAPKKKRYELGEPKPADGNPKPSGK